MIPSIVIVGADKGGVGKTTVCRVLIDYLAERNLARRVFDAESPSGDLKRFAPEAEVIDIGRVQDQMKIFDGASNEAITVVDLRGGMLSPTLQALDQAKLLEDVRKQELRLILLHVLGPTMNSVAEVSEAAKYIGGGSANHFVIKNHINQTQFFDWDANGSTKALWQQLENATINVPQLPEIACETLQKLGGSFMSFVRNKHSSGPQSRVLRGRVGSWIESVWNEFDRVGISRLITE
jgi:hypothetical protein